MPPAAPAPRARRCRSARRSGCRWWPPPGSRSRAAADGAAACRAASRPASGCRARRWRRRRRRAPPLQQHNRRFRRRAAAPRPRAETSHRCARLRQVGTIRANGLSVACLRSRSRATAARCAASTIRWKPPSPFTATIGRAPGDPPRPIRGVAVDAGAGRLASAAARRLQNASCGPHVRAGVGLRVEAAVQRVLVLRLHAGAHRETGSWWCWPVVGQRLDDAEARAAVGAVGERIAVTAVGGIEDFAPGSRGRWRCRAAPAPSWRPGCRCGGSQSARSLPRAARRTRSIG